MERRTELAELHSPPSAFLRIMNFCTNCILSHLRSGPPRSDACATRLSWGGGAYPSGLALAMSSAISTSAVLMASCQQPLRFSPQCTAVAARAGLGRAGAPRSKSSGFLWWPRPQFRPSPRVPVGARSFST
jgi:hypothetical protein